ncbi:MAG: DUF4301 family protein [Paludibacteraceae bacterium]|nr:DUF4301 family protein [Paludibacteraceae bacterium]MBP9648215.1 DUF4301 family protein [Paludibacteraceae bacterium]MBP9970711.1 DUF4301 family protein [Paludibacteraceae bacterium]
MFSPEDELQLANKGIAKEKLETQLLNFEKGFPYAHLQQAATPGNGIVVLNNEQISDYIHYYEKQLATIKALKFVPASGAASRMFKRLSEFLEAHVHNAHYLRTYYPDVAAFMHHLSKFAFYEELKTCIEKDGETIEDLLQKEQYNKIILYLLTPLGLNYGNLPKALLSFHRYAENTRTAFEEHLVEGVAYAKNVQNEVAVHFTISPEHKSAFIEKMNHVLPIYEDAFSVTFKLSFSEQKPSTDTIAVNENNEIIRNEDGSMLFRPGGHGALIENLNDCDADIIFIKNIDNVVVDTLKQSTYTYKKALAGLLLSIQAATFDLLKKLDGNVDDATLKIIEDFAKNTLYIHVPSQYAVAPKEEKIAFWKKSLNRPIRVCGMVKNEGEPGGGPFWVLNEQNEESLQVVESSQIDYKNKLQERIAVKASHFNPVDIVCATKNMHGEKFYLPDFVDPKTGFISSKSKDGKTLKAQELPGLWNGAMANWISIFVQVPISTFNPVKTVNDLLRKEHQA